MKLPADAIIARAKLTEYLLIPQPEDDKSKWLSLAGYTLENAGRLEADLRAQVLSQEAVLSRVNRFGTNYEIRTQNHRPKRPGAGRENHLATRRLVRRGSIRHFVSKPVSMKFELYKQAVLSRDVPVDGLKRGDVVTLLDYLTAPDGTTGYNIEVFNALGETIAVTAVDEDALEPLRADEVWAVRRLEPAA